MHLGLTYDLQTDPGDPRQAEFDPPATIEALAQALASHGHDVVRLGNANTLLRAHPRPGDVDLVFNIAEGTDGRCREASVPTLLELWSIPYVGADPLALSLGLDKVMTKRIALACGLPTPRWTAIESPDHAQTASVPPFPLIIKPRWEGSGRGIDAGAVARDRPALVERARWLWAACPGPMLVEEFLPCGELTVCVIGNDPPRAYPPIQRSLDPTSRLSCHVVRPAPITVEHPVVLDAVCDTQARAIALTMFEALGCRDVARVDLRIDAAGRPSFLEINPLPSFDPAGSFGLLAESLGRTYADLVGDVLDAAVRRLGVSAHV